MPSVKVCVWNVQDFGWGNVALRWGADSDLRNRFITSFVRSQKIDVLLIMEMTTTGAPSLLDLMLTLTFGKGQPTDWAVTSCGSALTRAAENPPTAVTQLKYKTGARQEGYAVAWRFKQTDRFTVVPALHPISGGVKVRRAYSTVPTAPLNMTTMGRPAGNVDADWRPKGGYLVKNLFPYDDKTLLTKWPKLEFPGTGKWDSLMTWTGARRPVYVVLDVAIGGGTPGQRLVPIGAYHAPSKLKRAELGALQAGLSRELYTTNTLNADGTPKGDSLVHNDRVVLGGDFNYEVPDTADWPGYYGYFTTKYKQGYEGGAACSVVPGYNATDAARRTVVRLVKGVAHDEIITGANIGDYLSHMIDLAFFRGSGVSAARVNIPALLTDPSARAPYTPTLKMFYTHLNRLVAALVPATQRLATTGPERVENAGTSNERWVPMLTGGWGSTFVDWATFMTQLKAGKLTASRQAAEFYRIFVSDHLPLVATIDL
ncbi:MAG TPA: hypothetical protein VFU13_10030 [Steroidobacteraceae bacterium]|nr:hypothetical protein [Steroidobacteraceae bacterium]